MMRFFRLTYILFATFFVQKLNAQTANITAGCAPISIDFTAPAGATSYYWDFKDGASSDQKNPSNTFTKAGTYTVEFRNSTTGPLVGTVTVKIYDRPIPVYSTTDPLKGCVPLVVTLKASTPPTAGITISGYSWTFGEGSSANGVNVSNVYTFPGVFDISIGITTNLPTCNHTVIYPKVVSVSNPIANFTTTPNPAAACAPPLPVKFTNTSISTIPLTYFWDLGNTVTATTKDAPQQTYTTIGNTLVTLKIKDTNGCEKSITKTITIGNPTSSFIVPDTVCIYSQIALDNISTPGFSTWTFDAGTTIMPGYSTSSFEPEITFTTAGNHNIKLRTTSYNGQCFKDTTIKVFVEDPKIQIKSVPGYACSEPVNFTYTVTGNVSIASYIWGPTPPIPNQIPNPYDARWDAKRGSPSSSTYTVNYSYRDTTYLRRNQYYPRNMVTITTTNGCVAQAFRVDTIYPVFARFMPDKMEGCAPLKVTFSDSTLSKENVTTYKYDYGDGTTGNLSNGNDHSHTYTNPGVYKVVLRATNTKGCFDISDTVLIYVGAPVTMNFAADKLSVCPGEAIHFSNTTTNKTNIDGWRFSSDGQITSHCFQDDDPTIIFNDSVGSFDVTLTGIYNGCPSTLTKANYIQVKGPIAKIDYTYNCDQPKDIQLRNESMGFTSVNWNFGDGTSSASASNLTHSYTTSGDYKVKLVATNATSGCPASIDSVIIPIRQIKANFTSSLKFCDSISYAFDASSSIDVHTDCYRGHTWIFSDPTKRPQTTEDAVSNLVFPNKGDQKISLVVSDINGCTDTLTKSVKVFTLKADFSISDVSICMLDTVKFKDLSVTDTTVAKRFWDFGDLTTPSNNNAKNPVHPYQGFKDKDTIFVKYVIEDKLGCKDTMNKIIVVYKPVSNFINPTKWEACKGVPVNFSATDFTSQDSNLKYTWKFGDSGTGTTNPINHTYANGGSYNVKLVYIEKSSGCKDSIDTVIQIQAFPTASFITSVDALSALCSPVEIEFTNQSTSTDPLAGSVWITSTGQTSVNPSPTFVFTTGVYKVDLETSTTFGCKSTASRTFQVLGPKGDFDIDISTICLGEKIKFTIKDTVDVNGYEWDFGDGLNASDVSPISHKYNFIPPSGQTVAKLTVFGDQNRSCPVTAQKTIQIREVRALFDRNDEKDTVLCLGEVLTIKNNSMNANVYGWKFGDGSTSSTNAGSFKHTYTKADTFSIRLNVINTQYGCKDTITKRVIVHEIPEVEATGDLVCFKTQGTLSAVSPDLANSTIKWSPTTGLSSSTSPNPTVNVNTSQLYTVTLLNTITGCSITDTAQFNVIPEIKDFNFDTTIVIGDSIYLPHSYNSSYYNYVWTPEDGLSCTKCPNPMIHPLDEVKYTVLITDVLGCSSGTGSFLIKIHPETFVDVPTTFTPNGDGVNDIIYVVGWGVKDLIYFQIYNRWGEMVFETSEMKEGWDGYYKGILQNNETYTFKASVNTYRNEVLDKIGYINLMR